MPAAAESTHGIPVARPSDELELSCIVCYGHIGRTEKVAYWPPTADSPGVIAHAQCLATEKSR